MYNTALTPKANLANQAVIVSFHFETHHAITLYDTERESTSEHGYIIRICTWYVQGLTLTTTDGYYYYYGHGYQWYL